MNPASFKKKLFFNLCFLASFLEAKSYKLKAPSYQWGFSLLEMIVTIAIFTLITSIILAKQSDFNNGILLTNVAYEVALIIRQAQVYGLGIKEASPGSQQFGGQSGSVFGYGIHVAENDPGTPVDESKEIIFFINSGGTDKRFIYNSDIILDTFNLRSGYRISEMCVYQGAVPSCAGGVDNMDIDFLFIRPNPDAYIETDGGSNYDSASVTISSPSGAKTATITITRLGQISVSRP